MTDPVIPGDIVEATGPDSVGDLNGMFGGALGLSRPRGPHKVHKVQKSSFEGGTDWALLVVPGNPYVTATWPVTMLKRVK